MKAICFYFQIHQPFRLKNYRFFDIGNDHYYYDDFVNEDIISRIAQQAYMPAADTLLEMIKENGKKVKVALSISGLAIEQIEQYVPEFLDKLKELAATGCVEFLSETYAHSLASLKEPEEFFAQVKEHDEKIFQLFGQKPKVFRNTELIFDDEIANYIYSLGLKGAVSEGAKHILGWKSPNYVYASAACPKLKILLRNSKFTEDISFRFSNCDWESYPLTADKYINWIANLPQEEQIVNLFMNFEVLGGQQPRETGIFEFLKALPRFAAENDVQFMTPSEVIGKFKSVDTLSVPYPMSWSDEARDTSAWLGNMLQSEAVDKLYSKAERVRMSNNRILLQDWYRLQSSDHFFYMCTKHHDDGAAHAHFSPYDNPHTAFTNYMNVLSDFLVRVDEQFPEGVGNEELNSLLTTLRNQASEIETLNREVELLRKNIVSDEDAEKKAAPAPAPAPAPEKKTCKRACKKEAEAEKPAPKKRATKKKAE